MVSTAKIPGVLFFSRLPRTVQPKMFFFVIGSPWLPARTLKSRWATGRSVHNRLSTGPRFKCRSSTIRTRGGHLTTAFFETDLAAWHGSLAE